MSPTTPDMQRHVARVVEAFQIEHGIVLPPGARRGLSAKVLASLLRMQPPNGDGKPRDSFLVPCSDDRSAYQSTSSSIGHAIRMCKQQHPNWDFTTRRIEGSGVRCWRIK